MGKQVPPSALDRGQPFPDWSFGSRWTLFPALGAWAICSRRWASRSRPTNFSSNFCATIAKATVENPGVVLSLVETDGLLAYDPKHRRFIERTFDGVFYTTDDLRFLDRLSWNLRLLDDPYKQAIAMAVLVRSCVKRQPRGVFTVAGDPERYKDGRRDVRLTLREHFLEQVDVYNRAVFYNGEQNSAILGDVFDLDDTPYDLVYIDPPYVPRSDDNGETRPLPRRAFLLLGEHEHHAGQPREEDQESVHSMFISQLGYRCV